MNDKNRKVAFITGISGQDGSYLADFLLTKDYEVHGLIRLSPMHNANIDYENIKHLLNHKQIHIHYGDVTNDDLLNSLIKNIRPHEVYHLAAQSNTPKSFQDPWGTFQTNVQSTISILGLIKDSIPGSKFYFAASSELFGDAVFSPQNEETPFNPNSPYGISKLSGFYLTKLYREKYSLFACSGICFSHESPRRGDSFVTRKITKTVAKIKYGLEKELRLGNLETRRDWGFSGDFVEAIWSMLQIQTPEDFVIGTGVNHTIKEFVVKCFKYVDLDWEKYVVCDNNLYRKAEKNPWLADASKSSRILGWKSKTSFDEIVVKMIEHDLQLVRNELGIK